MVSKKLFVKKKVFILGGNGFIGSELVTYFKHYNYDVFSITRKNYKKFVKKKCNLFINANGNSRKYFASKYPIDDFKLNVIGTINSVFDFKYDKYVFLSSIDVYGNFNKKTSTKEKTKINKNTLSYYGFTKKISEELIQKYTEKYLIIRLGGVLGKNLKKNPIFDISNNKKLFVHPKSKFSFISTYDIFNFILKTEKINNEIFNVSGEGTLTISDVIKFFNYNKKVSNKLPVFNYLIDIQKTKKIFNLKKSNYYFKEFANQLNQAL